MSAIYLIFSQLVTKIVTFAMNQVLIRNMSPSIFGMVAYFDFVLGSILFFSREAQRISNQRVTRGSGAVEKIVTFSYIPSLLALPVAAVVWGLQRKSDVFVGIVSQADTLPIALALLAVSVAVELLSEPFFAVNSYELGFRVRSRVESVAVVAKCGIFLGTFWVGYKEGENDMGSALLAYSVGQVAYAIAIYAGYMVHFKRLFLTGGSTRKNDGTVQNKEDAFQTEKELLEKKQESFLNEKDDSQNSSPKSKSPGPSYGLDPHLWAIWKTLFIQMIFKHLLTEGDTLILSSLFSISQQGIYSVIANYGSIIARLLFQPIEESVRIVTATALGQNDRNACISNMENHLVFYWNLSLLIVLGGYTNGAFMLRTLIGRNAHWANSPVFDHFSQYMVYLPFLAFNGVLEAFYSSASSQTQMRRFSLFLSVSSVAYFALLVLFIRNWNWGILGLILCNILNMCSRISYCGYFLWDFCGRKWRSGAFKAVFVPLGLFLASFSTQLWLFDGKSKNVKDFLLSVGICGLVLIFMLLNEQNRVKGVSRKRSEKKIQ